MFSEIVTVFTNTLEYMKLFIFFYENSVKLPMIKFLDTLPMCAQLIIFGLLNYDCDLQFIIST